MYEMFLLLFFVFSTTDSGAGDYQTSAEVWKSPCGMWPSSRSAMASSACPRSSRNFPVFFLRRFPVRFWRFFGCFSGFGVRFRFFFSLRPSGLPFPPWCFSRSARFWPCVFVFRFLAVLLHLASPLFRLRKQHCRKPGCNDPGPCRPSI